MYIYSCGDDDVWVEDSKSSTAGSDASMRTDTIIDSISATSYSLFTASCMYRHVRTLNPSGWRGPTILRASKIRLGVLCLCVRARRRLASPGCAEARTATTQRASQPTSPNKPQPPPPPTNTHLTSPRSANYLESTTTTSTNFLSLPVGDLD